MDFPNDQSPTSLVYQRITRTTFFGEATDRFPISTQKIRKLSQMSSELFSVETKKSRTRNVTAFRSSSLPIVIRRCRSPSRTHYLVTICFQTNRRMYGSSSITRIFAIIGPSCLSSNPERSFDATLSIALYLMIGRSSRILYCSLARIR